jgi:arylsulfatase A-like enzyme
MTKLAAVRPRHLLGTNHSIVDVRFRSETAKSALSPGRLLVLSLVLGLATGLVELVLLFVHKHFVDPTAISSLQLNQYALWMIPVSNGLIFGACGLVLAVVAWFTRARVPVVVGVYGLCFLSAFALLLTYRGLTTIAYAALAGAIALRGTPRVLCHLRRQRLFLRFGLPALIGLVAALFGLGLVQESVHRHQLPQALPNSPNILFIVLDTVRAESLSLYGYGRETSPHLTSLAQRGVRFDHARTAAAWTLPSHASMFTGRWPYELLCSPKRPLDATYPTLAQFLRDRGYATAGFVGNTYFCSTWYGLGRGFVHYEAVAVTLLEILRSSELGRILVNKVDPSTCNRDRPRAYSNRKDAATINADFSAWLSSRPEGRPFFAFLNYFDAHDPYLTPERARKHFGSEPVTPSDFETLRDWFRVDKAKLSTQTIALARDCYDDCIGYLDDQLGRLFDGLDSKGLLENTLVIVTADHGELFGEHGAFSHGQELYQQVVRVPLVIVAPGRVPSGRTITRPVSLRNLPATVVDLLGLAQESPFPGHSLAQHWTTKSTQADEPEDLLLTETADEVGKVPAGPKSVRALLDHGKLYIRNKDGREELYDIDTDPAEAHDLSKTANAQPLVIRFRDTMHRIDIEAHEIEMRRGL